MKYTVAEFKKNTRKILNEALVSPVTITRFDDEFVISNANSVTTKISDKKLHKLIEDGITDIGKRNVKYAEVKSDSAAEPIVTIESNIPTKVIKVAEQSNCKKCGYLLNTVGKCTNKTCK